MNPARLFKLCLSILTLGWLMSAPPSAQAQEPQAPQVQREVRVGYDPDRGAYIETADGAWALNPYGMVQLQNTTLWKAREAADTGFVLRSAKFILHGHVLSPTLTYHFQLNAGNGTVAAEDIYLSWNPAPFVGVLVGQNEVPFNRQHITLEAYQQFVERSSVDARFNLQRDLGVMASLTDTAHLFEWTQGLWNGAGQNNVNDDRTYMISSRFAWNPWGPIAFREADLALERTPKLSLAIAGAYNPRRLIAAPAMAGAKLWHRQILQGVFETTLRFRGISLSTETHVRRRRLPNDKLAIDYGQLIQLGVFLIADHGELVTRVGWIGGDKAATDAVREISGGANWYFHGHRLKLQADYANLLLASGEVDHRVRVQLGFFL